MRTAAQVSKATFRIQRYVFRLRNRFNQFCFVVLAQTFEIFNGFITAHHTTLNLLVFFSQLSHALFNRYQVFRCEWAAVGKVIIKTRLNHRTDGHLRFRVKLFDRISHQVRTGVTNDFQAFWVFVRHDRDIAVRVDQVTGINQFAIDLTGQSSFSQTSTNALCHFENGQWRGILALWSIR